jgi:hypothetical protein
MKTFAKAVFFLVYKSDRGSSFMNFGKNNGLQNLQNGK